MDDVSRYMVVGSYWMDNESSGLISISQIIWSSDFYGSPVMTSIQFIDEYRSLRELPLVVFWRKYTHHVVNKVQVQ